MPFDFGTVAGFASGIRLLGCVNVSDRDKDARAAKPEGNELHNNTIIVRPGDSGKVAVCGCFGFAALCNGAPPQAQLIAQQMGSFSCFRT